MQLSTLLLLVLLPLAFFLGKALERKNNLAKVTTTVAFGKYLIDWLKMDGHRMYLPVVERLERHMDATFGRDWRKK